jgi:hypothetical protein
LAASQDQRHGNGDQGGADNCGGDPERAADGRPGDRSEDRRTSEAAERREDDRPGT